MKIRSDIIKVYKDVHIWIGIVSGLMLFIAFYAGSVTMFEKPLERWATPPSTTSSTMPRKRWYIRKASSGTRRMPKRRVEPQCCRPLSCCAG